MRNTFFFAFLIAMCYYTSYGQRNVKEFLAVHELTLMNANGNSVNLNIAYTVGYDSITAKTYDLNNNKDVDDILVVPNIRYTVRKAGRAITFDQIEELDTDSLSKDINLDILKGVILNGKKVDNCSTKIRHLTLMIR